MKRTILLLFGAITLGTAPASAQLQKGNLLVGASFGGLSAASANNLFYISGSLSPRVGYFVNSRLVLGTTVNLGGWFTWNRGAVSSGPASSYLAGLQPFARYYLVSSSQKEQEGPRRWVPFLELSAGGMWQGYGNSAYGSALHFAGFAGGGVNYFLNKNVAIEATVGYRYNGLRGLSSLAGETSGQGNLGASFGLQFFLDCRSSTKESPAESE